MDVNGVINVYKEKGYTSHDAVSIMKRTLKAKAGHTGTLDPGAGGVLPIVLGYSTRLSDYIMAEDKVYEADIHFGITTDTQDITGNVISDKRPAHFSEADFLTVIKSFEGEISQIPPMYSAIKVGGEKLYNLARKGIEIERKPRAVKIQSIGIIKFTEEWASIRVACSKGTYIRTLCADIGEKLGCGAAMGELLRVKSGDFSIATALKLDEIKAKAETGEIARHILSPQDILKGYPSIYAEGEALKLIRNGNPINSKFLSKGQAEPGQKYRLYTSKEQFVGLYSLDAAGFLRPDVILSNLSEVR